MILKTFSNDDLKLVNIISFPYYFWLNQCFEKENKIPEKIDFANYIGQNQIKINYIYTKNDGGIRMMGLIFESILEIFKLYSESKSSFSLEFDNELLYGVITDETDIDSLENVQKWCKEKINFLKFVENNNQN